jgi:NitT/TauT family transport system ATP-binding protein
VRGLAARAGGEVPHSRSEHANGITVAVDRLSKTYPTEDGEVRALEDLTLTCEPGEFVSLLGPSGCGKSTALLMIAGLVPPTGGTVDIGGTRVTEPYTNLGFVFQDSVLLDWRRVLQNVLLQAELHGLDKRKHRARAQELLQRVGLDSFERRYPFELSGGMRQRVAICRALLLDPPLLFMDEPFGALDALTRDQLNLDLQELWIQTGKTVLFVTHSISEAVFLSNRVVVMSARPGRIEEVVEIDLPWPRPLSIRETDAFGEYTHKIREIFASLGILRDELAPG